MYTRNIQVFFNKPESELFSVNLQNMFCFLNFSINLYKFDNTHSFLRLFITKDKNREFKCVVITMKQR